MVTFVNGEADKNYYRHFKVRKKKGNDDTGAMTEVIRRRERYFKEWGKPDLIIVDGGRGQVGAFYKIIGGEINIVGIEKKYETLVFFDGERFVRERLREGPAKRLVQRIRNEAHRFARRYHHKLVEKAMAESG